jgi:hypothetical protein
MTATIDKFCWAVLNQHTNNEMKEDNFSAVADKLVGFKN